MLTNRIIVTINGNILPIPTIESDILMSSVNDVLIHLTMKFWESRVGESGVATH